MEVASRSLLGAQVRSPEQTEIQKSQLKRKKRNLKQQIRKSSNGFNIPGVYKLVLSTDMQQKLGCKIDKDINVETPWTFIKLEKILNNLELYDESSEFLPLKKEILDCPCAEILIGFIPDQIKDHVEFYICLTQNAADNVKSLIESQQKEKIIHMQEIINKTGRPRLTQETSAEVDETIVTNNRPLMQVLVTGKYPILSQKGQFTIRKAEDARDGYMELTTIDKTITLVKRKTVDGGVQVTPAYTSSKAQTSCTYPTNAVVQYKYSFDIKPYQEREYKKKCIKFLRRNFSIFSDFLKVNGNINLHTDDFTSLVQNDICPDFTEISTEVLLSFRNINWGRGRMVSAAAWHPTLSEIVAVAYSEQTINQYFINQNPSSYISRLSHSINVVLIWSTTDSCKPKIVLETHREVSCLSFCKFNGNILLGGCTNGQILVWDLTNNFNSTLDDEKSLNYYQLQIKWSLYMLMDWPKDIHCLKILKPTIVSDLKFSHEGSVVALIWSSPFYEFTPTGEYHEIPEHRDDTSLQYLSASLDGTVLLWDLFMKNHSEANRYKPTRQLRRLQKKPSMLDAEPSPFKYLLNLKPLYKINVKLNEIQNEPIVSMFVNFCSINYIKIKSQWNTVVERPTEILEPKIQLGSLNGHVINLKWSGAKLETLELVAKNFEDAQFLNIIKFHDGPVVSIVKSSTTERFLTAGGKIFALWTSEFKERPILWRMCKTVITKAQWNEFQLSTIITIHVDGTVNSWSLHIDSKIMLKTVNCSSVSLTDVVIHPPYMQYRVVGLGDSGGFFRLFDATKIFAFGHETETQKFQCFIDREITRKSKFLDWQQKWNQNHYKSIKVVKIGSIIKKFKKDIISDKKKEFKLQPTTDKYKSKKDSTEEVDMQKNLPLREQKRIQDIILHKKQVNIQDLDEDRQPLLLLNTIQKKKQLRRRQAIRRAENLFYETVTNLFPDVVKEKPSPLPDPYTYETSTGEKEDIFKRYLDICSEYKDYIANNPYKLKFHWNNYVRSFSKDRIRDMVQRTPRRRQPKLISSDVKIKK